MASYKKSKVGSGALASVIATIAKDYYPAGGLAVDAKSLLKMAKMI
jgi:hypothetical protein